MNSLKRELLNNYIIVMKARGRARCSTRGGESVLSVAVLIVIMMKHFFPQCPNPIGLP